MKRLLMALAATAALGMVPASAGADPGSGAQHHENPGCSTYADFGTVCWDSQSLENVTENKNSVSVFYHLRYEGSWTGSGRFAGCSESYELAQKAHFLFKKGSAENQVEHYRFASDLTIQCGAINQNVRCTEQGAFHYANGEVRHSRSEFVCEPI